MRCYALPSEVYLNVLLLGLISYQFNGTDFKGITFLWLRHFLSHDKSRFFNFFTAPSTATSQPIKMSHNYKTELFIPIRRHHGDFDDFFRSRWLEQNQTSVDSEFDRRRKDWDMKLDAMKSDFFHFSPFNDQHPHIESTRALQPVRLERKFPINEVHMVYVGLLHTRV